MNPAIVRSRVAERFSRAAAGYEAHAALQQAIAKELRAAMQPRGVVLDAGCGTGRDSLWLATQPGVVAVYALDVAPQMLAAVPAHASITPLLGDVEALPLPEAAVDQVFSNFALQWTRPDAAAAELARVLRPGGELCFSVPGPGSLAALAAAGLAVNAFADDGVWAMSLMAAGFADVDFFHASHAAHFATARELLQALKAIGANTATGAQDARLHGRAWWQRVSAALEAAREPAGIPLRYEVIHVRARRAED